MDEIYEYNGQTYSREQLANRYGADNVDAAIQKLGMKLVEKTSQPKQSNNQVTVGPNKVYEYNGEKFSREQLEQRYGDKADAAIEKLGMIEVNEPEEPVKKKVTSDSTSPDQNVESPIAQEAQSTSSDTKDVPWYEDFGNAFKSGVASTAAGIAGLKNFTNKIGYSIAKNFLPEEDVKFIDSLSPEVREVFINAKFNLPTDQALGNVSIETQNKLTDISKDLESKMQQYEGNIIDDFTSGNIGQGLYRSFRGAVQSSSSIALAMTPGGIGIIGAGTASQKQEELEGEGEKIDVKSILNSTINGVAEGFFERYTGKIGRSALKSFVGKKEAAEAFSGNMLKTIMKDTGLEASTEFATSFVQDLSDKLVQGEDISMMQIMKNAVDGGIIGATMGGTISAPKGLNGYIAKKSMAKDKQAKIDQKTLEAERIQDQIDLPEVPDELKVVLEEKKSKLIKEVKDIQDGELKRVENMPEEEIKEVFEVDEKIKKVAEKSRAIAENETIAEDVKESLLQDNLQEYEVLKRRKEYLSKTEFEKLPAEERKQFIDQAKELYPERTKVDGDISESYLQERAEELYQESKNKPADEVETDKVQQAKNEETNTPEPVQEEKTTPQTTEEGVESVTNLPENSDNNITEEATVTKENKEQEPIKIPEPKEVQVGKGTFRVETDQSGKQKVFKKDGSEVQEFTTRKLKNGKTAKVKNANYASIIAKANNEQTDNQINEERKRLFSKAYDNSNPDNAESIVRNALAAGQKISRQSIQKELSEDPKYYTWATGLNKETNLPSIEGLAENLAKEYSELNIDESEYRDAIINALNKYQNVDALRDEIINEYQTIEETENEESAWEEMNAYLSGLTPKERSIVEAEQFDESIDKLSPAEKSVLYEEEFRKQIESLPEAEQARLYEESEKPRAKGSSTEGRSIPESEGKDSEQEVIINKDRDNKTNPNYIARGTSGKQESGAGFYGFDQESAINYAEGNSENIIEGEISKDAKVLRLVDNHLEEDYDFNDAAIDEFISIIGEDQVNSEDASDITENLWGEPKNIKKLKDAGYDVVIGNTMDGPAAVVINEKAVNIIPKDNKTEGKNNKEVDSKGSKPNFYKEKNWDWEQKKDVEEEVVVFHGTGENFQEFDSSKSSEATRYGKGIAFTDGEGIATKYSVARQGYEDDAKFDEKAIVKKAKLTIEKPFDERNVDLKTQEAKNLIRILGERYGFSEELSKNILSGNTGNNRHTPFQTLSKAIFDEKNDESTFMFVGNTEKTRKLLEEAGYDSIIGTYEDANEYFVFDAKNVVSIDEKSNDAQPVNSEINISKSMKLDDLVNQLDKASQQLDKFGKENLGMNLPVAVAKVAIDAMKLAALTAKTTADVISAGINAVQKTTWYKNLSKSSQQDVENNFESYLNRPFKNNPDKTRADIETEVDELLDQGSSEAEVMDNFNNRREKMIAQDYLTRNKDVTEEEARERVENSFKKAEETINKKKSLKEKIDKAFGKFMVKTFDRQYLPKRLLLKAGGKTIRNYIIASKGASGYAKSIYDAAYDKIYKGLTSVDRKTLDKVIQVRRFIAIDENRRKLGKPDVVHPDFINEKIGRSYLESIQKELGDKKFKDLQKRADAYFDEFRGLLDKMYQSGIISKESRDQFFEIDYQPRQFLQFLKDAEGEINVFDGANRNSSGGLKQEQIQKLEDGLDTSLIFDSQYLLSRSINVRAKSIAMNNTNNKLIEFMGDQAKKIKDLKKKDKLSKKEKDQIRHFEELQKRIKDNPIIKIKDGKPVYKYDKIPEGFERVVYYKDGVKHEFFMEEKLHEQYFDVAQGLLSNQNVKEKVAMLSGTALVKSLATGNNPTFFISNTPRDLLFISTFSDEYGSVVPVNLVKLIKDTYKGVRDIKSDNDNFKKFVQYGGMMNFLHQQGDVTRNSTFGKLTDKLIDRKKQDGFKSIFRAVTFEKLQMYSEIGFRMAVFNRSIKNQLKQQGVKSIDDIQDQSLKDDIYTNAVASARSTTDFNQGGTVTKDFDAVIPYLNASAQGTRVMFDNLRDRPAETTFRIMQTSAMLTALPAAASIALIAAFRSDNEPEEEKELTATELYLKAMKGISKYERSNYMLFFTGGRTEDGEFDYYRLAKTHQLTPFMTLSESIQRETMKKMVGDNSEGTLIEDMKFVMNNNILPLEASATGNIAKVPMIKAAMTYSTGYDFFREQDLSYLRGQVPVVVEGFESSAVEDFYKEFGRQAGVSPARFKGAVESFITSPSTTPYVGMLYGGLDAMASDKDGKMIMEKLGKDILKSTKRRLKKETSEFNRRISTNEKMQKKFEEIEIESIMTKQKFSELAKKYAAKEVDIKTVTNELMEVYKESPFEGKRMVNKFKDVVKNQGVSPYVFEVKYANKPKQRALMLVQLFGADLFKKDSLRGDKKSLRVQMFKYKAVNKETLVEYNKLINE